MPRIHDYARLTELRMKMPTWQVARETGQRPVVIRNAIRRIEARGVIFPTYPNKPMERASRKGFTMNMLFTRPQRSAIRKTYLETGSIEKTAKAHGLGYEVVSREVQDLKGKVARVFKVPSYKPESPEPVQQEESPKEPPHDPSRLPENNKPSTLCDHYLQGRLVERGGCYFLDGKLVTFTDRMKAVNRERKKYGHPPLAVPEWQ